MVNVIISEVLCFLTYNYEKLTANKLKSSVDKFL